MWHPKWYRFFGPIVLKRTHKSRQQQLERIIQRRLRTDYAYTMWELLYDLQSYGVHNAKAFFEALLEYRYIEKDMHTGLYFVVRKKLAHETYQHYAQLDKEKKTWWI